MQLLEEPALESELMHFCLQSGELQLLVQLFRLQGKDSRSIVGEVLKMWLEKDNL